MTAVGATTVVAITERTAERLKERAAPSWAKSAQRVVEPAVKLAQFTVELPATVWNTSLLLNCTVPAASDAVKLA